MIHAWDNALTDTDKSVIEKGGYGQKRGFGSNPVLVVIDTQYNYVGKNEPIELQLNEWPSGGGEKAWKAINNIKKLKEKADIKNIPVIYTRNVQKKSIGFDSFAVKAKRDNTKYIDGNPATEIVDELKPNNNDVVVDKSYASAFFGTPLISYLIKMKVDTLIIVGGSTSGCVRTTAVDAVTRNFNVGVVEDCVFDRIELSHQAGLLDLWMKYCDVVKADEITEYFNDLKI